MSDRLRLRARRGSILILALWVLSVLAIYSATIAYGVRQKAALLSRLSSFERLHAIALSGVEEARAVVRNMDASARFHTLADSWASNKDAFKEVFVEKGFFSLCYPSPVPLAGKDPDLVYGLKDESGKISLNAADAPTLARLFEGAGACGREDAEAIGYAIVDWRDKDSTLSHPNHGAEDDYYGDLDPPYGAKNAPFEAVEELLLVKGVNRAIFDKIKGLVTVYGGPVNVNTAPKEVLVAAGIGAGLADRILVFRQGPDGVPGTADDGYLVTPATIASGLARVLSLEGADEQALKLLVEQNKLGVSASAFGARCVAALGENGPYLTMEAVIDSTGKVVTLKASEVSWSV